jgi:hypothetical protein
MQQKTGMARRLGRAPEFVGQMRHLLVAAGEVCQAGRFEGRLADDGGAGVDEGLDASQQGGGGRLHCWENQEAIAGAAGECDPAFANGGAREQRGG